VCDVETNILKKFADEAKQELGYPPAAETDFRKVLQRKEVDAVAIATPDHWHAPMAIEALRAGKHVYLEKPCSHNPAEGALLIEAQKKYGKLVQMGSQQRSSPHTIEIVDKVRNGLIGKEVPVPPTLDWELWQGPAPRAPYRDNFQPYHWHWFKAYGTGETLNNGTHEVDVARWILGVDYPKRVTASGGRYAYKDDWQFYDTLVTSFEYDDKMISWEGRSCEGMKVYGRDRGAAIMGTTGTVIVDRDGYETYNVKGEKTSEFKTGHKTSSADLLGSDSMTDAHFANLIAGIRKGEKLRSPIADGNIPVTMPELSNIAWKMQRELHIDPVNGKIQNDAEAMKMWSRTYQPGWEPTI
jgi:predicted dehydrogenase